MPFFAAATPFTWHQVTHWQFDPVATLLVVGAGAWYAIAANRAHFSYPRRLAFLAGLVITLISIESVVGVYDSVYFADHMIQHLMLIMIAAPLFALAAPLDLLYETSPASLRQALRSRPVNLLLHPLVAFGAYFVFIPVTHLTSIYQTILVHEPLHDLEHLAFLIIGYLFFRHAFGLEEGRRLNAGLRLVYVMAAVPVDSFTGLALAMSTINPFPAYQHLAPRGHTATSILNDIHSGGVVMWIGGDILMLLWCIPIAVHWVRDETRRTAALDAQLDAALEQSGGDR